MLYNTIEELFQQESENFRKLKPLNEEHIRLAIEIASKYVDTYKEQHSLVKGMDEKVRVVQEFRELCYKEVIKNISFEHEYWNSFMTFYDMKLRLLLFPSN